MQRIKGITLIELMISVAIVGIIAMIAIPSFQGQIIESRRGEAITQLLQIQMQQEAYRLENNSYATAAEMAIPTSDFYTFSVSDISAINYTLTATAKGSQTADSVCSPLVLDQSMNKTPVGCWL